MIASFVLLKIIFVSFPSLAHVIKAVSQPLLLQSVKTFATQKQRLSSPVERYNVIDSAW